MGIVSIVFGVIGLITSFLYIGLIFGVVGVTLGIVGLADYLSEKELPLVGLLISILGIVVSIYVFVSDIDAHKLVIAYVRDPEPVIEVEAETKAKASKEARTESESVIKAEPEVEEMREQPSETRAQGESSQPIDRSSRQPENGEYRIGQTWTVPGQWKLTINSVVETAERNQFSDQQPQAVYIITYTYENLGYEDDWFDDGLFISMDLYPIVDHDGKMGYSYPGNTVLYSQETPIGARCEAQDCIGVDNAGSFKIYFEQYDGNGTKQKATFVCDVN